MKVIRSEKLSGTIVYTDEDRQNEYWRFGPDSWYVWMGESLEPVYNNETVKLLESAYQETVKGGL